MNNGSWKPEEKQFVIDNAGKMTLSELSIKVHRSELAVQLFLHRNRIVIGQTVKRNLVQEILKIKFGHPEYFNPTKAFFKAVGINQIRWWNLYYGRKPITQNEYLAVATHFNISLQEAFNARQLNIFEENNEQD